MPVPAINIRLLSEIKVSIKHSNIIAWY